MKRNWARVGWWAARVALGVVVVVLTYAVAGLIGGTIPTNPAWVQPRDGIRIYVEDNGIHTGIVVPVQAAGVDWRDLPAPGDLRDPRFAGYGWRAFGWGDRAFYLETPTWADVRPLTVLRAAFGSTRTVFHAEAIPEPQTGKHVRALTLTPDQYRRLAAFIRATVVERGARVPGYGRHDMFAEARGTYSAVRTCNAWTGEALRAAGVRIGAWTPFPVTVMAWLPAN
jgi:uncharacterized protein (TIGR02117 family)